MNQENINPNNLKKVIIPFHEFIANKVREDAMEPNQEILGILLKLEDWETNYAGVMESPTELSERVKTWVPYEAKKDQPVFTGVGRIKYEMIYVLKNVQLNITKAFYQFAVLNAVAVRQYEKGLKLTSRGRATDIAGVIQWNIQYWPQYFKYYGLSGINNYLLSVLDYRRVFQIILVGMTIGAGVTRFTMIDRLTKQTKTISGISAKSFSIQPKTDEDQLLMFKAALGKKAEKVGEQVALVNYIDPYRLTELEFRNGDNEEISEYPYIGEIVKTDNEDWEHPELPTYEAILNLEKHDLEAIQEAEQILMEEQLGNLIETGAIEEDEIEPTITFNVFENPDTQEKKIFEEIFQEGYVKNISTTGITSGTTPDWKVLMPKWETKHLELDDVSQLFEPEASQVRSEQIQKTVSDLERENLIGKITSSTYAKTSNFEPEDLSEIEIEDTDDWDQFYENLKRFNQSDLETNEKDLHEYFAQLSMEDRGNGEYLGTETSLKRLYESDPKEQFKDLELVGMLLPSLFTWYAAYNLYRFRLHYIYDVRKKPEPILYTRLDHLGRLQGKVNLHEVVGVDGNGEAFDKLFAALQRARGMGIYLPTVLLTVWESTISPYIPGAIDHWLLNQRNKMKMRFFADQPKKMGFLTPEPTLAQKLLADPDKPNGYESRFNLLKTGIYKTNETLNKLESSNSKTVSILDLNLTETGQKLEKMKIFQPLIPVMKVKAILRVLFKTIQFIETELSNSPVIAGLKPGIYSFNNLPKGMLLVGDAGNGRSFLARAIASESRLPFFKTESTRFMDAKFGVMRLMSLFRRVRNEAPGILYIRDIDLITVDRERTNSPELIQLTTQFLICFDGYYIGSEARPTQRKIFTLGSVSDISRMDPACLRSGRFEWVVNLRKPMLGERKFLLLNKASQSPVQIDPTVAWNYFGLMTEGFTNAEVVSIVNNSTLQAIRKNTFVHTNESLHEGLNNIFDLRWNQKLVTKVEEGFFNELHLNAVNKAKNKTLQYGQTANERPFKTKCIHLLTSVKNWGTPNKEKGETILTMQNLGMSIQPKVGDYSQGLISELVDFMAEAAFIRQLQLNSPTNTFVTQTSYCGHLGERLNKTFMTGYLIYRLDAFTSNKNARIEQLKTYASLKNWEELDSLGLKDLRQRTNIFTKWYQDRNFCELKPHERIATNRFGYNPKYRSTTASMEHFKQQIKARLNEFTNQSRTEYAQLPTIRGTYGGRGFDTILQRPMTGPITQISQELLMLEL